jgi:conjugal transfer pilus assembly protein TraE
MNISSLSSNINSLRKQIIVLGAAVLVLTITLFISVVKLTQIHERVVVVPPGLTGPVTIDWGRADAEYMKSFGFFYATLLGTINPTNINYVADRLSFITEPTVFSDINKQIRSLARDPVFRSSIASANFSVSQMIEDKESGKIFAVGDNTTYSGVGSPTKTQMVYEMEIKIIEGRPLVMSVLRYPGNIARTEKWKRENVGWEKQVAAQEGNS